MTREQFVDKALAKLIERGGVASTNAHEAVEAAWDAYQDNMQPELPLSV